MPGPYDDIAISGFSSVVGATFNRPADTAAYVSGDVIGDNTVAATMNANVTPGSAGLMVLPLARSAGKTGMIRRVRVKTNDTAFAAKNVRVHFFKDRPTLTNGDNGAFLTTESNYLGYCDVLLDRHFSDQEKGIGVPSTGSEINFDAAAGSVNIYALIECRDAVTPGSAKTWAVAVETLRD